MKKLKLLSMVAIAAFAMQSCSNNTKDSKDLADSLNETKDTTTNVAATGGIAVSEDDAEFATKAGVGGMAEVDFSKIALSKTTDNEIKAFADMMVNDHGKANEELKTIATEKNITLPVALDQDHQKKLNELNGLSGKDFDKAYVKAMVDGHEKTYNLLEEQQKDGDDKALVDFAAKTLPIVKGHLEMIKKISDRVN
jgi:putative membrane protein